jgi:hypothetical protein
MASFRILNQAPQYLLANGRVNAGGKLFFYETDLTTPKDTWAEQALSTLNANPVTMDAAGRTLTDVWGEGEYGVVMADADDVVIWTRNNVQASGDVGTEIPALEDGLFLSNDGSVLSWQPILQVPDPAGHDGDVLYSDGEISYWGPLPETEDPAEPDIVIGTRRVQIGNSGDNTKFVTIWGTDTAPSTGTKGTSKAVSIGEDFDALWMITLTVMVPQATPSGAMVDSAAINWTQDAAGNSFTAVFNVSDDDSNPNWLISEDIVFAWKAEGTMEVVPE